MAKRDSDDYLISETGNWNTAAEYSKIKIMKPLDFCDVYENIAIFGFDSLLEELRGFNFDKNYLRIVGLQRLVRELLKITENAKFAMKKPGTKEALQKLKDQLERIWKIIPTLYKTVRTQSREIKIKLDPNFDKVLNSVLEIKTEINIPLNKNHLIFVDKQEIDPREHKKRIIEDSINKG